MKEFTITVSTYHKPKRGKHKLLGLNWALKAHYGTYNNIKKAFSVEVAEMLSDTEVIPESAYSGLYSVHIDYWYKSVISDLDNSAGLILKFFNDVLQEVGVIENDNMKQFTSYSVCSKGQDRDNPRATITFTPISSD